MHDYRTESDFLGPRQIPAAALYGIHTHRALENFPLAQRAVHPMLVHAYGSVKLACARTNHELGFWDEPTFEAIECSCQEMCQGLLDEHVRVDALQGGAGTSTNMNVNEVLTNRTLQLLGKVPGDYQRLHPLDDLNLHQSTNDTYPTALKVAAITMLRELELDVVSLLEAFQEKEKQTANVVKVARTQYQDAVLITLGREMSAYAEAFSRDRWRIYKCQERLRVVNLGGTAVGTTLGAPRQFVFRAVEHLREITGHGLARAENLVDATQNTDIFVEVSGILKALASNLLKIASDLRLLSSGPDSGLGEIRLPRRQAGSSIMPAKVNPVIPEAVIQAAMVVIGNDAVITQACSSGSLELNAFLPLIADKLLSNLELLQRACSIFRRHCVEGIEANLEACRQSVEGATATATALIEQIGYQAGLQIIQATQTEGRTVREVVLEHRLMTAEAFDRLISPASVMRLGSSPARSHQ
jgi:aspartate ammonia-lyase